MATTTNYGWTTPDDTDLVKDGAAAIRTLGSSVDTTTKALNPETTTGDIAYRSATANTNTRLALGTAGQILTVNSGATAPEWANAPSATSALTLISSESFSAVTSKSINNCFSATYDNYMIYVNITSVTGGDVNFLKLRLSGTDSSADYNFIVLQVYGSTVDGSSVDNQTTGCRIGTSSAGSGGATRIDVYNPALARPTYFYSIGNRKNGASLELDSALGNHDVLTAYDGLTLITTGSAFAGNIRVYGVQNA
jgi:hypothetical protein